MTHTRRQRYKDSQPIHATHDTNVLATRTEKPDGLFLETMIPPPTSTNATSHLSNVCCQDVDEFAMASVSSPSRQPAKEARIVSAFQPPPPPSHGVNFSLGILTISDRAAANQYETGDLSGPAVEDSVRSTLQAIGSDGTTVSCIPHKKAIVADNMEQIQRILREWTDDDYCCDLILTTGGTGFAATDVTPEATVGILEKECRGLLSFVTNECSQQQPLASLSRGTAGIRGNSLIVNLPGNPAAVREVIPILLPILLHAIYDMKQENLR